MGQKPPIPRPATPTMAFAPARPPRAGELDDTEPSLRANEQLAHYHRERTRTDPELAAAAIRRNEELRRESVVDRLEKEQQTDAGALKGFAAHVDRRLSAQDETLRIFARTFGIEEQLPDALHKSDPPPDPGRVAMLPPAAAEHAYRTPTKSPGALSKVEVISKDSSAAAKSAKQGTHATYAAIVLVLLEIVLQALRNGGH